MDTKYIIAFDVGGTRVKTGLFENRRLASSNVFNASAKKTRPEILRDFQIEIERMLQEPLVRQKLAGIAFAMPAIVDVQKGAVLSTNEKYRELEGFNMKKWVFDRYRVPCFMDNDARMALVGEWQFGAARGVDNAVMMTLGTGIGTAAIIEGRVLRGKHYQAGCLGGHFTVDLNGNRCNCGNRGCLESSVASWNLGDRIKKHYGYATSLLRQQKTIDFEVLFKLAEAGDMLAQEESERCIRVWAAGIVNLIHAYDPEVVVLGGGIMKSKSMILKPIAKKVRTLAWTPWGEVNLVASDLQDHAALYGLYYGMQQKIMNE